MAVQGVPSVGDTEISVEWLSGLLHDNTLISGEEKLTTVEIQDLQGNRGASGAISRLVLSYDNKKPKSPLTLILKMSPPNSTVNISREAFFYNQFGKQFEDNLPHVLYSEGDIANGSAVMLMRDVKESHNGIGANYLLGNQIWGIPEGLVNEETKPEAIYILERAFLTCAEWHGAYWNDESLKKNSWLKSRAWYNGEERESWEGAVEFAKSKWFAFKENVAAGTIQVNLHDTVTRIIEESFNTSWEHFQEHIQSRPFTLCHGDYHASNMAWVDESPNIKVFDWSEVGLWEPCADLGQTVISDYKPEVWKGGKDIEVLRKYWNKLLSMGVSAEEYPFETCQEDYCRAPVERWITLMTILSFVGVPDHAVQHLHDKMLMFVEEHPAPSYKMKSVIILNQ